MREVVVEAAGVLTDRSDVTAIVEQTVSQQTPVADIAAIATVGIAKGVGHYSDAAIGAIARAMLRVTSTVEDVEKVEKVLLGYAAPGEKVGEKGTLGLNAMSALVAAMSRARGEESRQADDVMLEKVQSLRAVLEQRLASGTEVDMIQSSHVATLLRGYSTMGQGHLMMETLSNLRAKGYVPETIVY